MGLKNWFKFKPPIFSLAQNLRPFSSHGVIPRSVYIKYFVVHALLVTGLVYGIMAQNLRPGLIFWLCSSMILFSSGIVYLQEVKRLRDIFGKELPPKYFYLSFLCLFPFIGLGLFLALASVSGLVSAGNARAQAQFKQRFALMTGLSFLAAIFVSNSLSRGLNFESSKQTAYEVSKRLLYNNANVATKFMLTTANEVLDSFALSDQALWKNCIKENLDHEHCLRENFKQIDEMKLGTTGQVISSAELLKQMYQDLKKPKRGLASKGPMSLEQLQVMSSVSTLTVHSAQRIRQVQPLFKRIDGALFNLIFGGAQELILLDLIMELNRKEMFLIFKERALALTNTALEKLQAQNQAFQAQPEVQQIAQKLQEQLAFIENWSY